jgi:glutathione S-transferase
VALIVHHLNNSRSQRVLWLLEELEIPYEIQHYKRLPSMLAPPELKRIHPLGKSPVITDNGVVVAESAAIIEYILDKYGEGRLRPLPGSPEYLQYRYWMYFAEGSAMSPLLMRLVFSKIVSEPKPFFIQPIVKKIASSVEALLIAPNVNAHLDFEEETLTNSSWFAGAQFSAADIMMSLPLEASRSRANLSSRRHLVKFLEAIHARPAYKRALERGGPYEI